MCSSSISGFANTLSPAPLFQGHSIGKLEPIARTAMVLCGVQSVFGVLLLFSFQQLGGLLLCFTPLLVGFFGFYAADPVLMILYAALMFYHANDFVQIVDAVSVDGCVPRYGNDHYCNERWATFLSFLAVLLYYIR